VPPNDGKYAVKPNSPPFSTIAAKEPIMGSKLVTEAMRKATPPLPGAPVIKQGVGQRKSQERGSHTRSKKNPGKRPHQG
jgi:hypothetical protein